MSKYIRSKNEWLSLEIDGLKVIDKVGETPYDAGGKYMTDVLLVKCNCGKERKVIARSLLNNKPSGCRYCSKKQTNCLGQTIGHFKCVEEYHKRYPSGRSRRMVRLECTNCEKSKTANLYSWKRNELSCLACYPPQVRFVEGSGKPINISKYFYTLERGAKSRNYSFDVTIEQILQLLESQNNKCALSGKDISFDEGTASLDRIDSTLGYYQENIQWVHRNINFMKNRMDQDQFIELCSCVSAWKRE